LLLEHFDLLLQSLDVPFEGHLLLEDIPLPACHFLPQSCDRLLRALHVLLEFLDVGGGYEELASLLGEFFVEGDELSLDEGLQLLCDLGGALLVALLVEFRTDERFDDLEDEALHRLYILAVGWEEGG
jgi:hypothetical protein